MDIIFIEGLRISTHIGIYPREKKLLQPIDISLKLGINAQGGTIQGINDTIDYSSVVKRLSDALTDQHFDLLEQLAEYLATLLMTEFATPWVSVTIVKPSVIANVKQCGVTIERSRQDKSETHE